MIIYQQIILLELVSKGENPRFKGKYVIENVVPYYDPLIPAHKRGRHLYWTNFNLPNTLSNRKSPVFGNSTDELNKLCEFHDYNFKQYKGKQSTVKIARNLVEYEAGKTILQTAIGVMTKRNVEQIELF